MPALLALTYLNALLTTTRGRVRDRVNSDVGATTLELVIIVLGLIAVSQSAAGPVERFTTAGAP
jgi:hypothetical protein